MTQNLVEVFDLKENILTKLVDDDLLVKALLNVTTSPVDAGICLYKNIYPWKKIIDDTIDEQKNFITLDYAVTGLINDNFKESELTFYVLVHENLMVMDYNSRNVLRTDFLAHRIDAIFNKTRGFGIGRLKFGGLRPVEAGKSYIGLAIHYIPIDFD